MSAGQHAVMLTTGFAPVGVVTALSVQKAQHEHVDFCARAWSAVASPSSDRRRVGLATAGAFRPSSVPASPELMEIVSVPNVALSMVLTDLQAQCRSLGATGVLALTVETTHSGDGRTVQYRVTGTAVRSPDGVGWFSAHLSGDEFAKLLLAGWMPVSVIAGTAVGLRHEVIPGKRRLGAAAWRNMEVETWTDVMQRTRAEARADLSAQLGLKSVDGALLASESTQTRLHSCPAGRGKDRMVRTTLFATAVRELAPVAPRPGSAREPAQVGPILSTIRTGL